MSGAPYNLPDYRWPAHDGRTQNHHIFVSNFTYTDLVWQKAKYYSGNIMAAQGNAFVIGGGTCTTLGNYTLTDYARNGLSGLVQLLINEDTTTPVYLYIKFTNPPGTACQIGVLLTNDTTSPLDTISGSITMVASTSTNPATSTYGGYTCTATTTDSDWAEIEVIFKVAV